VCALHCAHAPPIERISIRGDLAGALGFVRYADPAHRYVITRSQLLDAVCTLFGGREAEALLCEDVSIGAASDLERATEIARRLVEELGLGGDGVGVRRWTAEDRSSEQARRAMEAAVHEILERERARAQAILQERKQMVIALRDLLIERKVLDRQAFAPLLAAPAVSVAPGGESHG
jgi:cell division protease FtsH